MRSKYQRVSDQALLTADECETLTIELLEISRAQLRDYILHIEPALLASAAWISHAATERMVAVGLAGPLTGAVHEDIMHAAFVGYILGRGGATRLSRDVLDGLMPSSKVFDPTRTDQKEANNE